MSDYKAWYDEAIVASNELGYAGMSAAQVIRHQAEELAAARKLHSASANVIDQFMPNVGKCFGIDFQLLNETLLLLRKAGK